MSQPIEVYENGVLIATEDGPAVAPEFTNRRTIEEQAAQALEANRLFLAIASPTQAQSLAQIRALSRQVNALIRLALGDLSGTD